MSNASGPFKHVKFLWNQDISSGLDGDEVALLIYRSNLLGADIRLTNYGGGNTSCKNYAADPLTGKEVEVMWIKGSGGDLGSLRREDLSSLYMEKLKELKNIYRGKEFEDDIVSLYRYCLFDPQSRVPSIDTALHALLPFRHIDHLHPDAAIAIAASKDGKDITRDLFEGRIGWIDWQRPGFDLGVKLLEKLHENPGIRGIMLGSHGLFTWDDTSLDCYRNTLQVVDQCTAYIESNQGKSRPVFGGVKISPDAGEVRKKRAAILLPMLRGMYSGPRRMIAHFTDEENVMEFVDSHDLEKLSSMGTSCPDHFLRTKIRPLVLPLLAESDFSETSSLNKLLKTRFESYRKLYESYYNEYKHPDSPPMRDATPVVILLPGLGMCTFAKDKAGARIAAEYYTNAINVMRGAESISSYTALSDQEAFGIEYWKLEQEKLDRMPGPKPLAGRVALITGSGGGIGKAIASKFASEGACVLINDLSKERLQKAHSELEAKYGKDVVCACTLDVTDEVSVNHIFTEAALQFGGVDIVVNCAGISISKPLEEHTEKDWVQIYDILVKGQFLVTRSALYQMRLQGLGGDILNIVSKNALVSGPDNAAYGSAKAAQLHLSRLNAAELGKDRIRVNVVNPDAVIEGSHIWEGAWAQGRAQAYGITVEQLPSFYANRTLLQEVIHPEDIANACFAFVGGLLNKSTGNVLNVDGGVASAFVR
jgi:rhamnulose-1-phosphate aldolase/alcohol dehydrogenase